MQPREQVLRRLRRVAARRAPGWRGRRRAAAPGRRRGRAPPSPPPARAGRLPTARCRGRRRLARRAATRARRSRPARGRGRSPASAGQCSARKPRSESRSSERSSAPGSAAASRPRRSLMRAPGRTCPWRAGAARAAASRPRASCSTASVCSPRPATRRLRRHRRGRHQVGHVRHLVARVALADLDEEAALRALRIGHRLGDAAIARARHAGLHEDLLALGAGALRGPALDQRQQRRPVRLLGRHGGEARVGLAFGIADGLEQHLEVLLRHRRDHHVAVAGAHRLVDLARPLGRELRRLHLVDQHAEHRVHQRDVDVLAAAALLALVEGELDRAEGVGGAHHVGDEDAVVRRPVAAALVLVVGELVAGRGMDHRRVGRRRGHRPGLAEAGDRGVDQPRVVARQGRVVEAEPLHHARAEVLDHDVGLRRQLGGEALAVLGLQVEDDALLAAVHRRVVGADAAALRRPLADHVAVGRLDLHHLGAGVGEHAGAHRPRHDDREVDDLEAGQGRRRVVAAAAALITGTRACAVP